VYKAFFGEKIFTATRAGARDVLSYWEGAVQNGAAALQNGAVGVWIDFL
jgi:hypothetical protein